MSLITLAPNLDDRTFQDLVDEAKRLIPRYCPEWTDHNVSDPGIALIELFAWMTESIIFRLNRVPDKTQITFLDLLGVRLLPPQAAVADLTFRLSARQDDPVHIPAGTEVATVRTPDWEAITFSTTEDLVLEPATHSALLTSPDGRQFEDRLARLVHEGIPFYAFEGVPRPGNAWYIGFAADLSRHLIRLRVQADKGTGPKPNDTPLCWEAWLGEDTGWVDVKPDVDTTQGLLTNGFVEFDLPPALMAATFGDRRARSWIRARVLPSRVDQDPYDSSPRINTVFAETIGGTAPARHAERVRGESIGFSDGTPSQTFRLDQAPILPRRSGEYLEVSDDGGIWTPWEERSNFADSGPDDRHYTLDDATGIISLGPRVRAPNGSVVQHGAVPPKGAALRFTRYHVGGGTIGNVAADRLVILKSSLSYVARVTNRHPATGGADLETLEHAKLRAGTTLRTLDRAVTAADYETLATQASTAVARARCLDPASLPTGTGRNAVKSGTVVVVILPTVGDPMRPIEPGELRPPDELRESVRAFLDQRRLVTTAVEVRPARIIRVMVVANIACSTPAQTEYVRARVAQALYRLLNPVVGGPDGEGGWPFGRDLSIYDVHAAIQRVPGVELIDDVRLSVVDERDRARDAGSRVTVPADAVIASAPHTIIVGGRRR